LTVTITVYRASTQASVNSGTATEIAKGMYTYTVPSGSVTAKDMYGMVAETTDATVDQKSLFGAFPAGADWVENVDQSLTTMESDIRGADGDTLKTLSDALDTLQTDVTFLKDVAGGRWKVNTSTNQLELYKSDNTTPVATFDLKDKDGNAAATDITERTRV
jgi:hypothetical protein